MKFLGINEIMHFICILWYCQLRLASLPNNELSYNKYGLAINEPIVKIRKAKKKAKKEKRQEYRKYP